ncbi:MAG: hypothetical protein H7X71_05275 [Chitinophagales bacterium]|nr:hypothetical protein [Chitinophagales bacterium]
MNLIVILFGNNDQFDPSSLYKLLLSVHSLMRYLAIIVLIWAILAAYRAGKNNTSFLGKVKKPALFTIIVIDIQFLIGAYLWIVRFVSSSEQFKKLKRLFVEPNERYIFFEHAIIMFIAILLIHIGYTKSKKAATDNLKSRKIFVFYLIAFILIMIAIPWPFMPQGRHLLPF